MIISHFLSQIIILKSKLPVGFNVFILDLLMDLTSKFQEEEKGGGKGRGKGREKGDWGEGRRTSCSQATKI